MTFSEQPTSGSFDANDAETSPKETQSRASEARDDAPVEGDSASAQDNVREPLDHPPSATPSAERSNQGAGNEPSRFAWLIRGGINAGIVIGSAALILFLIGVAQRSGWVTADGFAGLNSSGQATDKAGNTVRYICPMMCTPPSSEPGRCPVCGMELVPATGSHQGDGISITVDAVARRLAGIQTATSQLEQIHQTIRTVGSIDFDESRLATISAYIDGRIETLYADYIGVKVSEGDDLALLYSPELFSAQTEYVTSLQSKSVGRFSIDNTELLQMAREKLSELGMSESQIESLKASGRPQARLRIKSPQTGTVLEKTVVEGDYVKTGQKIYRIADLSSVWLMLDLFPEDAALVRFGQHVEAEIASLPGEVFTGRVAFIDPTVNPTTQTVSVRVEILNLDGKLRPGDYANARIRVPAMPTEFIYDPALAGKYISPMHPQVIRDQPGDCPLCGMPLISTEQLGYATEPTEDTRVVTVPRDAVLLTGQEGVVYVESEPGRFEIRRVTIGPMNDERAIIVEGIAPGEVVATEGNFLIDSQMQLAGNPSLMDPNRAPTYAPGPLQLPERQPVLLSGQSGAQFDRAFDAYFKIQTAMAGDAAPPSVALNTLVDALNELEILGEVPDEAQTQFAAARRAAERMGGSLETARKAYRGVSRAMLIAATAVRGPDTAQSLGHYYCPMVPGGGGDWMQSGGELRNPYWGSEMLGCGELVEELNIKKSESRRPPIHGSESTQDA